MPFHSNHHPFENTGSEAGLIRGYFERTNLWTLICKISCHRAWRCVENGLISGIIGLGIVWSEVVSSAQSSVQWFGFGLDYGRTKVWTRVGFRSDLMSFPSGKVWSATTSSAHGVSSALWSDQRILRSRMV